MTTFSNSRPPEGGQEVFDASVRHMLAQGRPAVDDVEGCSYRTKGPGPVLKCAAGCLIADEDYRSDFEGKPVREIEDHPNLAWMRPYIGLLTDLQCAHDCPDNVSDGTWDASFRDRLREIADGHGLSPAVLDEGSEGE